MELMNTIETANNGAPEIASIFDTLNGVLAKQEKAFEQVKVQQAKANEIKREILEKDTEVYMNVATKGYFGISSAGLDGHYVEPVIRRSNLAGKRASHQQAVMYAFWATLCMAEKCEKNHIAVYMNDDEVRRVQGMIKRIREAGDQAVALTEKELSHIEEDSRYGDFYKTSCDNVFQKLQALMKTKKIRVMGLDTINAYPLSKGANLIDLAGKTYEFKNGQARFYDDKRMAHVLEVRGFNMNGKHKLVIDNNRLAVERIFNKDKDPEKFLAQLLKRTTHREINIQYENERYEAVVSGYESEEQAVG